MQPYSPRPIVLLEPIGHEGWQLKVYSIVFGDSAFNRPRFDGGLAAALRELPSPAKTADRPGAGFVILHQGRDVDYVVLAWWDRENELPLRVFVRERVAGKAWRVARGGESVCVWDLQVIAAERDAYVDTVMGGGTDGVAEYMTRSAATELTGREMLRHAIATLAYRGGKALRGAPSDFATYRVSPTSRTPAEVLAHIGDLFDWAGWMARGEQRWVAKLPGAWDDDVARFFAGLGSLDEYIASGASLHGNTEKLFQGPIADALTHVGQLTMLRRAVGHPIRGESYARADIRRGQVGAEQAEPRVEFD
ncbi:MAG: hypothetical protein JWM41_708 [Gemmatimonadetes bacterium]|nr:hypothetical protein [Gemmatimonadota bacterium]